MAKRSQRRPSRHERAQAGCIWSLISVFAFRNGKSTRRLLSDRKRFSKQTGTGQSSAQIILPDRTENCEDAMHLVVPDGAKTSVKELMEVEMFNEESSRTSQPNDSEISLEQISSTYKNHTINHQEMRNRSRTKSCDMDVSLFDAAEALPENCNQVPEHKPPDDLDLERIMDELSQISQSKINCLKHDEQGDLDPSSGHAVTAVEEKLAAAIKTVIEERLSSSAHLGEDANTFCSTDFVDALQTLSLNKGLFLKLLQDSNSTLVKHIQNLEDAQAEKDQDLNSLSEEKPINLKSDECNSRKHRNFFRRRSKSVDSCPSVGDKDSQSPNKVVIWKPWPAGTQSPQTGIATSNSSFHKAQNDRNMSHFSFTEIKRKLRNAMGKDKQGTPPDRLVPKLPIKHQNVNTGNKGATGETLGWKSPNRNHFYTERFAVSSPKKGEPVDNVKDKGSLLANETGQCPRIGGSNIYIEAKKHLSEMLENGDATAESRAGRIPKSLGRILSLPEYNGSPCRSPRKFNDDIFITAQMRLSPRGTAKNNVCGSFQENLSNHPSPRRQNLENQQCSPGIISQDKTQSLNMNSHVPTDGLKCPSELQSFTQDAVNPRVAEIEESSESKCREEEIVNIITSETSSTSLGGDSEKEGTSEADDEKPASQILKESILCFKSDLYSEDQRSPSHSPVSGKVEDADRAINKMEQPSPISILEPVFTDEDISPASTMSRGGEKEIQPRHINFEEQSSTSEQAICTGISLEGEESAFEYVEAVLLGSGLNWDDFLSRWLSSYKILDPSLFDEVELFSSRPHHDQKLLFDSANESLYEVCKAYFGCFTGISDDKPNARPVPRGMDLIHEIWNRVEGHLFQHPQPHSLDQLVKIDLAASGKWMSLQSDIELVGSEMEETIFDEFLDDFVLSFIDDISDLEFSVLQSGPQFESIEVTVI